MCSHGDAGICFGALRITPLLFADDVVLPGSSGLDLELLLEQ